MISKRSLGSRHLDLEEDSSELEDNSQLLKSEDKFRISHDDPEHGHNRQGYDANAAANIPYSPPRFQTLRAIGRAIASLGRLIKKAVSNLFDFFGCCSSSDDALTEPTPPRVIMMKPIPRPRREILEPATRATTTELLRSSFNSPRAAEAPRLSIIGTTSVTPAPTNQREDKRQALAAPVITTTTLSTESDIQGRMLKGFIKTYPPGLMQEIRAAVYKTGVQSKKLPKINANNKSMRL